MSLSCASDKGRVTDLGLGVSVHAQACSSFSRSCSSLLLPITNQHHQRVFGSLNSACYCGSPCLFSGYFLGQGCIITKLTPFISHPGLSILLLLFDIDNLNNNYPSQMNSLCSISKCQASYSLWVTAALPAAARAKEDPQPARSSSHHVSKSQFWK